MTTAVQTPETDPEVIDALEFWRDTRAGTTVDTCGDVPDGGVRSCKRRPHTTGNHVHVSRDGRRTIVRWPIAPAAPAPAFPRPPMDNEERAVADEVAARIRTGADGCRDGNRCTRKRGHSGDHFGTENWGETIMARWPRSTSAATSNTSGAARTVVQAAPSPPPPDPRPARLRRATDELLRFLLGCPEGERWMGPSAHWMIGAFGQSLCSRQSEGQSDDPTAPADLLSLCDSIHPSSVRHLPVADQRTFLRLCSEMRAALANGGA